MSRLRLYAVTAAAAAACCLPAYAHVTVNPDEAAKGSFAKLAFRVPNERAAGTTKVEVLFPADHPVAFVSVRPHAPWSYHVTRRKLATPLRSGEGTVSEVVASIVWEGGTIRSGEFEEFELSVGPLPTDTDELVFKALQTYADGTVVRWVEEEGPGGAEPEHPAPVLELTAATGDHHHGGAASATPTPTAASASASPSATAAASPAPPGIEVTRAADDARAAKRVGITALVVAGAAALLGVAGLIRRRPRA